MQSHDSLTLFECGVRYSVAAKKWGACLARYVVDEVVTTPHKHPQGSSESGSHDYSYKASNTICG